MKIEKISDTQIRCTLNKSDLIDRELRISELAYGTEKAKALFRDMIQQAFYEFGFEADDIPLMIEAIPVSTECLILVITKVEDPDELDTRFSKFSSFNSSDNSSDHDDIEDESYADEIINCFDQIDDDTEDLEVDQKDLIETQDLPDSNFNEKTGFHIATNLVKIYSFRALNEVIELANVLLGYYNGSNTLYKNPQNSIYYLVINKSNHSPEEFNKICNIISEYGKSERSTYASSTYYDEHYEVIVKNDALQILSVM